LAKQNLCLNYIASARSEGLYRASGLVHVPYAVIGGLRKRTLRNVEVTGAARLYRAASVWTAGLGNTV
jgi:hypothetical protein